MPIENGAMQQIAAVDIAVRIGSTNLEEDLPQEVIVVYRSKKDTNFSFLACAPTGSIPDLRVRGGAMQPAQAPNPNTTYQDITTHNR